MRETLIRELLNAICPTTHLHPYLKECSAHSPAAGPRLADPGCRTPAAGPLLAVSDMRRGVRGVRGGRCGRGGRDWHRCVCRHVPEPSILHRSVISQTCELCKGCLFACLRHANRVRVVYLHVSDIRTVYGRGFDDDRSKH